MEFITNIIIKRHAGSSDTGSTITFNPIVMENGMLRFGMFFNLREIECGCNMCNKFLWKHVN